MPLIEHLNESTIRLHLTGSTKEEILAELVNVLVESECIAHGPPLLQSLIEREALGSTGIGYGVAIPHGRCQEVSQPAVVLGRTDKEVEFGSIDGQPARLFFLIVAPESGDNEHLHLLAAIARLMKDAATRESLLKLESPREIVELIAQNKLY